MVLMRNVRESNVEHVDDMLVVEGVEDIFAITATFYEVIVLKQLELVRDRRLRHVDGLCNIVDAELVVSYRAKYFHSRFIAENLEKSGGASYEFF